MNGPRTLVVTGAASGLGREFARLGAERGFRLVLADLDARALEALASELRAGGTELLWRRCDVAQAGEVEALAAIASEHFGAPNWLFNNAGVACGGLLWESPIEDWQWLWSVNVMGVVHGIQSFVPRMLERARREPEYRGVIMNTASMAGLINAPLMGVYNASKHAVVSISETLEQDLRLVTSQLRAAVLCPYFVPTGIAQSERHRPAPRDRMRTLSQELAQRQSERAVASAKVSARNVAERVFAGLEAGHFYLYSHPQALGAVEERLRQLLTGQPPGDPFAAKPEIGAWLREALAPERERR
ncbi:MAG: SDR family NAD(P)-dependent oxidoreductase [Casimicrobiaceae bacterium]|nr:SDR family NAD(P)-dependent oxidoreductase [Casimicrobiaceae bacterium]MCX8098034.1 SDR family NAD(P)-dependent oxidoreductase [Casimicrobiaceae bacterium]MDW8312438.1 SDR family NAD(P)-dependent oxidoreductase [Burkholderiales bacterium]